MLLNAADRNITYNKMNWAYQIKTILDSIGMTYVWDNQFESTVNFLSIKQRIIGIYKQSWYARINSKLSSYSLFKHDLVMKKKLS